MWEENSMKPLNDKVAVVTGASRNIGRGIALTLGEVGATVYITGRSTRTKQTTNIPRANIEDTAHIITEQGGTCIPVKCDHRYDDEVKKLFERISQEQDKLDILVNNAWGGYETLKKVNGKPDWEEWMAPFWEQSISRWDTMFRIGVRSHLVSSYYAIPLMMKQARGLIVNTGVAIEEVGYPSALFYWLSKFTVNKMTYKMAQELKEKNIAVIALAPDWVRTEEVLMEYNADDFNACKISNLEGSESTQFVGRAVVALASDPNVMLKSGEVCRTRLLSREYGFTDVDGRLPPINTH